MKYRTLSKTEQELYQANVEVTLDYTDFAALANSATGTFYIAPYCGGNGTNNSGVAQPYYNAAGTNNGVLIPTGNALSVKAVILDTPFTFSDASLVNCGVVVGDSGSSNRYVASQETAAAATYVSWSIGTGTRFMLNAAGDNLIAVFTGTSGHYLNTATAGQIRFICKMEDWNQFPASE